MATLIVLEGPAGSGKTYTEYKLADTLNIMPLNPKFQIARPRNYLDMGPELSLLRDVLSLETMMDLMENELGQVVATTTRMMFSQIVYESLRQKRDIPSSPGIMQHITHFCQMYPPLYRSLRLRKYINPMGPLPTLKIHFEFLIPTDQAIQAFRSLSGREFPFSWEDEIQAYQTLYSRIDQIARSSIQWAGETNHLRLTFHWSQVNQHTTPEVLHHLASVVKEAEPWMNPASIPPLR